LPSGGAPPHAPPPLPRATERPLRTAPAHRVLRLPEPAKRLPSSTRCARCAVRRRASAPPPHTCSTHTEPTHAFICVRASSSFFLYLQSCALCAPKAPNRLPEASEPVRGLRAPGAHRRTATSHHRTPMPPLAGAELRARGAHAGFMRQERSRMQLICSERGRPLAPASGMRDGLASIHGTTILRRVRGPSVDFSKPGAENRQVVLVQFRGTDR
jgi:hypothetical protein